MPRLSGTATVTVEGSVSDRAAGSCELWRYRAAGDVFLQIEKWPAQDRHPGGRVRPQGHGQVLPGALTPKDEDDMYKVVLLRHGESDWNSENRFTGWTDVDLSDKGREEAKAAGQLLKKEGYAFDQAFTSVLKRAIRTLWLALDEMDPLWLPVERTWRLNERHYGALQGLNKAETAAKFGDDQVKVWRRSYDIPPPPLDRSDERFPGRDRPLQGSCPRPTCR